MTQLKEDILYQIANAVDADELVDRLGYDIEELVDCLAEHILDNLDKFSDLYDED